MQTTIVPPCLWGRRWHCGRHSLTLSQCTSFCLSYLLPTATNARGHYSSRQHPQTLAEKVLRFKRRGLDVDQVWVSVSAMSAKIPGTEEAPGDGSARELAALLHRHGHQDGSSGNHIKGSTLDDSVDVVVLRRRVTFGDEFKQPFLFESLM